MNGQKMKVLDRF